MLNKSNPRGAKKREFEIKISQSTTLKFSLFLNLHLDYVALE